MRKISKRNQKSPSDERFNTDFWKEQRRKTLIESTGASMRLSGSKVTNKEVEKIIDSEKKRNHSGVQILHDFGSLILFK